MSNKLPDGEMGYTPQYLPYEDTLSFKIHGENHNTREIDIEIFRNGHSLYRKTVNGGEYSEIMKEVWRSQRLH